MKRKDFSHLKIEVQNKKDIYFEHEGFIAGAPPFLRGIDSFPTKQTHLTQNEPNSIIKLDLSDSDFEKRIEEVLKSLESNSIFLSNNNEISSQIQIAQLLLKTKSIVSKCINKEIKIDTIASKISFSWKTTDNLPIEIAKIRATRMLWAKMTHQFQPKNQKSLALQIHIENNNFASAIIAIMGGAQSISQNNAYFNYNLPKTLISKTIDPWAGSTAIEKLTEDFAQKTWQLFLNF